jgi:hypothetical protein
MYEYTVVARNAQSVLFFLKKNSQLVIVQQNERSHKCTIYSNIYIEKVRFFCDSTFLETTK